MYIDEQITVTVSVIKRFDDDICQGVFCLSPSLKLMLFCVYKPCDATSSSFISLLNFITDCIENSEDAYNFKILILGDFNFPSTGIWNTDTKIINSCTADEKTLTNSMNCHFLTQYVDVSTRGENILDLCFTNIDELIYQVNSESTILSDHKLVNILLSAGEVSLGNNPTVTSSIPNTGFQTLKLFKADFTAITNELSLIDWDKAWEDSNLEDFPQL